MVAGLERPERQPVTSATRKPGFGGSLKGNLDFERRLIVDNLSGNPRPACSFLRYRLFKVRCASRQLEFDKQQILKTGQSGNR
jgi:hypothetical protein